MKQEKHIKSLYENGDQEMKDFLKKKFPEYFKTFDVKKYSKRLLKGLIITGIDDRFIGYRDAENYTVFYINKKARKVYVSLFYQKKIRRETGYNDNEIKELCERTLFPLLGLEGYEAFLQLDLTIFSCSPFWV